MKEMTTRRSVIAVTLSTMLLASCAMQYKKVEKDVEQQPVNCATAEADIRVLEAEKTHTGKQIAAGVTSIVPIGLVAGIVTGTAGTKARVASGKYNDMLDAKIAEIKKECGL